MSETPSSAGIEQKVYFFDRGFVDRDETGKFIVGGKNKTKIDTLQDTSTPYQFIAGEIGEKRHKFWKEKLKGNNVVLNSIPEELRQSIRTQLQESGLKELDVFTEPLIGEQIALQGRATDGLTGLRTKTTIDEDLSRVLSFERRMAMKDHKKDHDVALIMLDFDHFKKVNDEYGHQAGDIALKTLARVLKDVVRKEDFVYRYGGEEFCIVLQETTLAAAQHVAEKVRLALEGTIIKITKNTTLNKTVSLGIANLRSIPDWNDKTESELLEQLINRADVALYQSKGNGRNQTTLWDSSFGEEKEEVKK